MGDRSGEAWKALYAGSSSGSEGEAVGRSSRPRLPRGSSASPSAAQLLARSAAPAELWPGAGGGLVGFEALLAQPPARRRGRGRPPKAAASAASAQANSLASPASSSRAPPPVALPPTDPPAAEPVVAERRCGARQRESSERGGALGLLEPSSSDSEAAELPRDGARTNASQALAAPATPQSATPPPRTTAAFAALAAGVGGARQDSPPRCMEADEVAEAETQAADAPEEPSDPQPRQQPSPSRLPPTAPSAASPPRAPRASAEALMEAFLGPDDGLAPRWAEGSLTLSGGVVLPERIAACLRPYQREGVRWIYERLFVEGRGCLLTDEMGLGKTVQVACALVAGLYCRPRNGSDGLGPVLVLCPPTLVQNWARELRRWGPFAVESLTPCSGAGQNRLRALRRLEAGLSDVMVASNGLLRGSGSGAGHDGGGEGIEENILLRAWGTIVIDEVHQAKNPKGLLHRALVSLNCPRKLGLTGTPLQNSLSDIWSLLRAVGAHGDWELAAFESRFARPIARGQKRKASVRDLAVREDALKEFKELLDRSCLRRTKGEVALSLPGKNDRIVPCPLSYVQRAAYRNLVASPDFQLALGKRKLCVCGAGRPCLCGVGPVWLYVHRRQAEQKGLEDEWAAADECACRGRSPPRCLSLSLIVILQRLTNHIEQLKPEAHAPRDSFEEAQQGLMRDICELAFKGIEHNLCTSQRVANRLQLGSPEACGKMQVLMPLLRHWRRKGHKILVFSRSTQLLDILEACLWQQGWSPQVLRLDGTTPSGNRQRLVDEFNASATRGVFLISTRAGGVGLNLTSASVVVIFDPDWNPFSDLQAQDRSFRIGQTRVVEVYRFLGAGTIEEQVYVRQVWKQQMAASAIDGTRSARRLDDGASGLSALFELHASSVLPELMAGAFTTRTEGVSTRSEGGFEVFDDLRGPEAAPARLEELCGDEEDKIEQGSEASVDEGGCNDPTQGIERLHRMFDQIDHAKVVRNDTQEMDMLADLQEEP